MTLADLEPMIAQEARRLNPRGGALGVEDLEQVGRLVVCKLLENRVEYSRRYVRKSIRGRMIDELRRMRLVDRAGQTRPGFVSIEALPPGAWSAPDPRPSPRQELERADSQADLYRRAIRALDNLPRKMRAVVYGRFVSGQSIAQVAAERGIKPESVEVVTCHGLARIRQAMAAGAGRG